MSTVGEKHSEVTDGLSYDTAKTSPAPNPKSIRIKELKKHLSVEVTTSHADILLLICCIISGLVDSTIYNAYGTFVSMQTVLTFIFLHFRPAFPFLVSLHSDHGSLQGFLGQYNLPRSRRFHFALDL